MDNIGIDNPASSQTRAASRTRRPWQPPELTKETVEAATAQGVLKLDVVEVTILLGSRS